MPNVLESAYTKRQKFRKLPLDIHIYIYIYIIHIYLECQIVLRVKNFRNTGLYVIDVTGYYIVHFCKFLFYIIKEKCTIIDELNTELILLVITC